MPTEFSVLVPDMGVTRIGFHLSACARFETSGGWRRSLRMVAYGGVK